MPDKIILQCQAGPGDVIASSGDVSIEIDGIRKKLKRVKSLVVRADADGTIEVDMTMYAANLDTEVIITRANAEAILAAEYGRQLAFLTTSDRQAIRELREELRNDWEGTEPQPGLVALDKLIAELDRKERELEDILF